MKRALDLGCGRNKVPGAIGVYRYAVEGVDVVHDLDAYPYPFQAEALAHSWNRVLCECRESASQMANFPEGMGGILRFLYACKRNTCCT